MAYAESESMALKRLKVALKRKDWQFFDYGIARTKELIKSGTKISEIQQWYELLDTAKNETAPEEEIQKLTGIIEGILTPAQSGPATIEPTIDPQPTEITAEPPESSIIIEDDTSNIISDSTNITTQHIEMPTSEPSIHTIPTEEYYMTASETTKTPEVEEYQEITKHVSSKKIPLAIFINKNISSDQTKLIDSIRYSINKLSNENETNKDFDFLSTLSTLLNNASKETENLEDLMKLIKNCPEAGIIITSSYGSELTNLLTKNDIDYSIDKIKKPKTDNYWKIYPLRGSSSIFWCPKCKNRTFYNNDEKTIVTTCENCSEPAYPDLYAINANNPQTNPKIWYHSYQKLTHSENWLLISPPKNTENEIIYDLIATALSNTDLKQTYIVSNDSKTTDHWKNQTKVPAISCSNLPELVNEHLNL